MEKKILEASVPLTLYLSDVKNGDISDAQDVQRHFCSSNSFINGLGVSVLVGNYIPAILLGEIPVGDGMTQTYIIDGGQRTGALMKIRYGGYKFTRSTEHSVIEYQAKKRDEKGKICKDCNGKIIWEKRSFDIKNKTFDDFPEELQKEFDKFQLRIATYQNCTMDDLSEHVRMYNNNNNMNVSQQAFTYLPKFGQCVQIIEENDFFKNTMKYSEKEYVKSTYRKLVCESVMSIFHLDNWKKTQKVMIAYLNQHAERKEFDSVSEYLDRLYKICDDKYQGIFVQKNIAVWLAVFDKFTKLGLEDVRFLKFLDQFKLNLHNVVVDKYKTSWDELDGKAGTKDKSIITTKIELLVYLMLEFFNMDLDELDNASDEIDALQFVKENVDQDITQDDVDDYYSMLDEYDIDKTSRLLDWRNDPSLVAIIAWSFKHDIDLDDWIKEYFDSNNMYFVNQVKNYRHMKKDLEAYLQRKEKMAV